MQISLFARQLMEINERLSIFRVIDFAKADRIQSTARQHLKVLECINARDIEGAREAIISNIQDSRDNVHTTITEALGRAYQKKQMT
ncbi:MAG: FCD domain-containing protein [Deltaproteobacteria bacterium]|nr:FCD domain-containing protein [Deltaproteobacteria bacterium]